MFWSKKKKEVKGLPDLPSTPKAIPSMKDFHKIEWRDVICFHKFEVLNPA